LFGVGFFVVVWGGLWFFIQVRLNPGDQNLVFDPPAEFFTFPPPLKFGGFFLTQAGCPGTVFGSVGSVRNVLLFCFPLGGGVFFSFLPRGSQVGSLFLFSSLGWLLGAPLLVVFFGFWNHFFFLTGFLCCQKSPFGFVSGFKTIQVLGGVGFPQNRGFSFLWTWICVEPFLVVVKTTHKHLVVFFFSTVEFLFSRAWIFFAFFHPWFCLTKTLVLTPPPLVKGGTKNPKNLQFFPPPSPRWGWDLFFVATPTHFSGGGWVFHKKHRCSLGIVSQMGAKFL